MTLNPPATLPRQLYSIPSEVSIEITRPRLWLTRLMRNWTRASRSGVHSRKP